MKWQIVKDIGHDLLGLMCLPALFLVGALAWPKAHATEISPDEPTCVPKRERPAAVRVYLHPKGLLCTQIIWRDGTLDDMECDVMETPPPPGLVPPSPGFMSPNRKDELKAEV